jgi:hypothetical protein
MPEATITATPARVTDRLYDNLVFSNNAYGGQQMTLPTGWVAVESVTRQNGYQATVFINEITREVVIAHRGTEIDREAARDLGTDGLMFFTEAGQEKSAESLTKKMMERYSGYNFSHTGHSLGGFLAEEMSLRFGQRAVSFDSPGVDKSRLIGREMYNITSFISNPNAVNSIPELLLAKRVGNVFYLGQDGVSISLDSHDLYNYMRFYFDPITGQLRSPEEREKITETFNEIIGLKLKAKVQFGKSAVGKASYLMKEATLLRSKLAANQSKAEIKAYPVTLEPCDFRSTIPSTPSVYMPKVERINALVALCQPKPR